MVLAGCGGGGAGKPAVPASNQRSSGGGTSLGTATPITPRLQGDLGALASGLHRPCQQTVTRYVSRLLSVRWVCVGDQVSTATLSVPDGRRLSLGDLFTGDYIGYLQSTATAQLHAAGSNHAAVSTLSAWALTPDSLQITFPAGTVSFPLASLTAYVRHPGPLSP